MSRMQQEVCHLAQRPLLPPFSGRVGVGMAVYFPRCGNNCRFTFPRMVVKFPVTGMAKVKRLRSLHNSVIVSQNKAFIDAIAEKPVSGVIELL